MGASSTKLPTNNQSQQPDSFGEQDIIQIVLLAHGYDKASLFNIPKDVIGNILQWYIPNSSGRPYLLSKPLSRSHYRICEDMCVQDLHPYEMSYALSIDKYDPHFQSHVNHKLDLVSSAKKTLKFLLKIKEEGIIFKNYDKSRLDSLFDDYLLFLLVKCKEVEEDTPFSVRSFISRSDSDPSLEVSAIWFSHMLQSGSYQNFIERLCSSCRLSSTVRFRQISHVAMKYKDPSDIEKNRYDLKISKTDLEFIKKSFNFLELKALLLEGFTPQMAIDDQLWLVEFLKFTRGTDIFSQSFLEKAHLGYQRMMYLKWLDSHNMEQLGFAPVPSVDLIWHTHLCHPYCYEVDMKELLGYAPKHKLLKENDRTFVFMNDRDNKQETMWMNNFKESLFNYAT